MFSSAQLLMYIRIANQGMLATVVEASGVVLHGWDEKMRERGNGCGVEIDVDEYLNKVSAQVISKLLFGSSYEKGFQILDMLKLLQQTIFRANRFVGIPGINRYGKSLIVELGFSLISEFRFL